MKRLLLCTAAAISLAGPAGTIQAIADEPTVLHFAPGAITLRTSGTLTPAVHEHRYSLDVRKGQTLTFHFDGAGPLAASIDCQGESDGPFSGYGDTYVVPVSGPCIVTMLESPMGERWAGAYTLSITAK